MDNLIDGRAIAGEIQAETAARVIRLKAGGITPGLVFIRVGEDPASQVYVAMKQKRATEVGIRSETKVLPQNTTTAELLKLIDQFNADSTCHGILVQAPLPSPIDAPAVYSQVTATKDVDGFHPLNVGKLMLGDPSGFVPCTPAGIHELLIRYRIPVNGAEVVVLGRGNIVGKPMAAILLQKGRQANATVTVCHSGTRDVTSHCQRADILIAAMGVPEFVRAHMIKPGATVIDVGVNRVIDPTSKSGTKLVGDVAFSEVQPKAGRITPNPGGVGPMTIAMLLANTVRAAEQSVGMGRA
ncbi:MAG TPA: bifunctional 5,10-methylenetetrahydrofolate dehydrogenase/5,10-methenyltetrahydrofolate cyclohydrolase [Verrucomicrobiota bacterium]|nr:bifunctional 5,10-methylene-tetrahydrofolate dehydrogenase/5,10-methylene-tetrahydrofolate cyclohydrolase [Verrucomicrobiales bacterium]HRI12193.1 bifunctional 5,10-methylenetetrahydrofolate dehydrogenase/5,10-methenyltetrahydrofolate cyclohydrolase [Verrucomicrobiota bacterium]